MSSIATSTTEAESICKKQQETSAQLNALLEQSAQAITCGPTCQKMKNTQQLEQQYLNAQTNIQTAPIQLENARKAFYTFTEGTGAYNTMLEKDLQIKANEIGNRLTNIFNKEIELANTLNTFYNSDIINTQNTIELYETYRTKNKELEKGIKNTRGDVITNDRKSYYETQQSDNLTFWYRTLMTIYYLLLVVFFLGTLFSPNKLSVLQKIVITVILFIYPFIISPIANYVIGGLNNLVTFLFPKNVYKHL
jgi:hypothetical protein